MQWRFKHKWSSNLVTRLQDILFCMKYVRHTIRQTRNGVLLNMHSPSIFICSFFISLLARLVYLLSNTNEWKYCYIISNAYYSNQPESWFEVKDGQ